MAYTYLWIFIAVACEAEQPARVIRTMQVEADGGERSLNPMNFSYEQPDQWPKLYPACGGKSQSPINIDSGCKSKMKKYQDNLFPHTEYTSVMNGSLMHKGYTLQLNGDFGNFSLPDADYEVKHISVRIPGEHQIECASGVGELRIVHQRRGAYGSDGLAIVTIVLIEAEGSSNSSELQFFENMSIGLGLPNQTGSVWNVSELDLNAFSEQLQGDYYHYVGSLTSPPCTEGVHWFVMATAAPVTPKMLKDLNASIPQSNRPVQPLNKREVVFKSMYLAREYWPKEPAVFMSINAIGD